MNKNKCEIATLTGTKEKIIKNIVFPLIFVFSLTFLLGIMFLPGIIQAEETVDLDENSKNQIQPVALSLNVIVVGLMILMVMVFLIWEPFSIGFIALSIPVFLVVLSSWTNVSSEEALSGFSNQATITVMAMFVLSKSIQNSGVVQFIGAKIEKFTGDNVKKQIGTISGITGILASVINNTPVVAAFIPMVTNLAYRTKISPSKLLIPLSYASMLGGTITLFGTSTNILASQVSERLINHPFSMFEFSKLGIIVLGAGVLYLIIIGDRILPERITIKDDLIKEYGIENYLAETRVLPNSSIINNNIEEILTESNFIDIIKIIRDGEEYMQPLNSKTVREGDHLIISAVPERLFDFIEDKNIEVLEDVEITQKRLEDHDKGHEFIELVVPDNSFVENKTISEVNFLERYDASLLAIRHGEEVIYKRLLDTPLKEGDVLLLLVTKRTLERLNENLNFIIEERKEEYNFDVSKIVLSFAITGAVIALAALNVVSIAIAALGGVVAIIATGLVSPQKAYEAINWEVFFLLSGLIPLGLAVEQSGTAQYLASHILNTAGYMPPIVLLGLFYFITALLAAAIGNNASVVLMLPVAVKASLQLAVNPFAFVLVVTFAASGSFMSPIGYQTNLMVYGPGGYKFTDYIKMGAPLQLLLTIIVPVFVTLFWGL